MPDNPLVPTPTPAPAPSVTNPFESALLQLLEVALLKFSQAGVIALVGIISKALNK